MPSRPIDRSAADSAPAAGSPATAAAAVPAAVPAAGKGRPTPKRSEAQRAWKRAQLAFNERLGTARVSRLHAIIDECMAVLDQAVEPLETA